LFGDAATGSFKFTSVKLLFDTKTVAALVMPVAVAWLSALLLALDAGNISAAETVDTMATKPRMRLLVLIIAYALRLPNCQAAARWGKLPLLTMVNTVSPASGLLIVAPGARLLSELLVRLPALQELLPRHRRRSPKSSGYFAFFGKNRGNPAAACAKLKIKA
jgi:hypothetical protein